MIRLSFNLFNRSLGFTTISRNLCHHVKNSSETDEKVAGQARKIGILKLELETFRQDGDPVPNLIPDSAWEEILEMESRSQRRKFYKFLCIKERHHANNQRKKEEKRLGEPKPRLEADALPELNLLEYGLNKNTIHLFLRESTLLQTYNQWQVNAMQFGPKLVYDMGYDEFMSKVECKNTAEQLMEVYAANRVNREQFHLMLCNASWDQPTMKYLEKFIPNLRNDNCLLDVTARSYSDIFPKDSLVYLTPHCDTQMRKYDPNTVYIIGGLVDKSVQAAVSLAKAKREKIAMQKLPLDDYLDWGVGAKTLTLDQMMKILITIKESGDWTEAFKHVPRRKIKKSSEAPTLDKSRRHSTSIKNLFGDGKPTWK